MLKSDAATCAVHQLGGLLFATLDGALFDVLLGSFQGVQSLLDAGSIILLHEVMPLVYRLTVFSPLALALALALIHLSSLVA